MGLLKGFLTIVLVLTLAAGGVYVAANRGLVSADYLSYFNQLQGVAVTQPQLAQVFQSAQSQFKILSAKTGSIATQTINNASQSGSVLGSTIEVEKNQPPLPQRAFELARYSYCQEVIKDYESRQ